MGKYIAILRGINVSGQKKIKMAELKAHLSELDFGNIQTYIQSGNVIFDFTETDAKILAGNISAKIKEKYGFDVPVIVKTVAEFEEVANHNPYDSTWDNDDRKLLVTFLDEIPAAENFEKLQAVKSGEDKVVLVGKAIYLHCPNGYGTTKFSNNLIEQKLKVIATTRNWRTVNKLVEMGKG
ncbi:DUF1697 domain-containing protein [Flexithrix dorotheae]|uniref:DUF1697 domain-containing protein n=1 Tax=Flexithrix dorotheae TaxID=70993 RepID=UPI00036D7068|nr:DUF1697 domain-containing protein [Flexithrix dorotheae]